MKDRSASLPNLTGTCNGSNALRTLPPGIASYPPLPKSEGVTMKALLAFLFPPHLCNPESTGRMDVFAHYGPCDETGQLHGGWNGHHIHTDLEIRHMINELNKEQLLLLLARPRETVETMINEILPKAKKHAYTEKEIHRIFRVISPDESGHYKFLDMQNVILADQRRRLLTLISGKEISKDTRRPVPYQSLPGKILTEVTTRKKLRPNEEIISRGKKMNVYSTLIAPLEQQNLSAAIDANVSLLRNIGDVDDRWDRYCAVRGTGKISYVGARNTRRIRFMGDDDLADKAHNCSTLTATRSMNGPLDRRERR